MDHHFKVGAGGLSEDFRRPLLQGQRPNGIYIPRFRNLDAKSKQKDYIEASATRAARAARTGRAASRS
jgi:hypothetical protein